MEVKLNQSTHPLNGNGLKIKPFLGDLWNGLIYSLNLDAKMITHKGGTTVTLSLNPNISYRMRITDPKLQFLSANPDTIPRSLVRIGHNAGIAVVYLKVCVKILLTSHLLLGTNFIAGQPDI